jgi:hypothetical protein
LSMDMTIMTIITIIHMYISARTYPTMFTTTHLIHMILLVTIRCLDTLMYRAGAVLGEQRDRSAARLVARLSNTNLSAGWCHCRAPLSSKFGFTFCRHLCLSAR